MSAGCSRRSWCLEGRRLCVGERREERGGGVELDKARQRHERQ